MHIVMPAVFVLAWLGAAVSWAVAAYSTAHVWTESSSGRAERHRARTFKAAIYSATFIVMGFVAGTAGGLFGNLHV
jgi:hypothetical protein